MYQLPYNCLIRLSSFCKLIRLAVAAAANAFLLDLSWRRYLIFCIFYSYYAAIRLAFFESFLETLRE